MPATRTDAIATYTGIRESFGSYGDHYAATFKAELAATETPKDDFDAIIALAESVGEELNREIYEDMMDEAYQDDIDSGWAAERAALSRAA